MALAVTTLNNCDWNVVDIPDGVGSLFAGQILEVTTNVVALGSVWRDAVGGAAAVFQAGRRPSVLESADVLALIMMRHDGT